VDTNAYYALLAPLFGLMMLVEALLARRQGLRVYRLGDTLANLSSGMGQILVGVFTAGFILAAYGWFHGRFALVRWPDGSPVPWVLALVGVDVCYYWWHRTSHRVGLLWAIHAPHHQSEEMNISVALRQPFASDMTALLFFWPLPLLGVPREAFFLAVGILSVYEALMHTRLVSRTGVWGWALNTPSTHRLHHASNERYRDRNFGSTIIVWDRLFGTFVRETEPPRYGTVTPLASANPLWGQVQPLLSLARGVRRRGLRALVLPPSAEDDVPTAPTAPGIAPIYALVQWITLAGLAMLFLRTRSLSPLSSAAMVAVLLWGTGAIGGLLDGRRWAVPVELARLAALAVIGVALGHPIFAVASIVVAAGSALSIRTYALT
jgi:alkylglycerol monooxygenase